MSSEPLTSAWTVPSGDCHTSTAADPRQPSTGNVMSSPFAVPCAPIPAAKPPAKSCAAASENGPTGSMLNSVTSAARDAPTAELDDLRVGVAEVIEAFLPDAVV